MYIIEKIYNFIVNDVLGLIVKFYEFLTANPWLGTLVVILLVLALALLILTVLYKKLKGKFLEKLVYKREFSVENVYAGETVNMIETIYNPTFFPLFRVDVEEYFFGGLWFDGMKPDPTIKKGEEQPPVVSRFTLMPFMQTKRKHEVFCEKRGHFQIKSVCIYRKGEPLFVDAPADIYVYPAYVEPMINSFPVSCLLGEYTSRRRLIQDPFSFAGIRDYRFGDPTSIINYKATAKHPVRSASDIMVNMRDYSTGRIFMVYLNFHLQNVTKAVYENYEKVMEYGLSVASAVIRDAIANGCKVGFAANCPDEEHRYLRYSQQSNDEHFKRIMQGFASLNIADGISIKLLLQDDIDAGLNNSEIIFLTTYIDDEIDDRLRILKQYSNAVSVIHIGEGDIEV